jgi:hypothetical protein
MNPSNHAIEKMGYRRRHPDESLTAKFSSISAFWVQGVALPEHAVIMSKGLVDGAQYSICLANSFNAACTALVDEEFCEDETAWLTQNKCAPPSYES